jgi:hypothetical protein
MNKRIPASPELSMKIKVICCVLGHKLSEAELLTLEGLIERSENNSLFLSIPAAMDLRGKKGLSDSALSTALHRLQIKKLIARNGKTISLLPAFNGIQELENLVIDFTGL